MKQNKFDLVMDYIDANIQQDTETLKKGIYNLIGFNSNTFGNCFSVLTNNTLFHYISKRRMFFASKELQENLDKPICAIALDYGYSDQSAFTRAIKAFYQCTPNDIRKGYCTIHDNKINLKDFNSDHGNTRIQRIFHALENNENLSIYNIELMMDLEKAANEYGFDFDTCCAIAELAEKLEVSPLLLVSKCFHTVLEEEEEEEEENRNSGFSQQDRIAIECGIESDEELKDICEYFDCKYYDLDSAMVRHYKKLIQK